MPIVTRELICAAPEGACCVAVPVGVGVCVGVLFLAPTQRKKDSVQFVSSSLFVCLFISVMAQGKGRLWEGPPAALVDPLRFLAPFRWFLFVLLARVASIPAAYRAAGSEADSSTAATTTEADVGADLTGLPRSSNGAASGRFFFAPSPLVTPELMSMEPESPSEGRLSTPSPSSALPESSGELLGGPQQPQQWGGKRKAPWMAGAMAAMFFAALVAVRFREISQRKHLSLLPSPPPTEEEDPMVSFSAVLRAADRLAFSIGTAEARGYMRVLSESYIGINGARQDLSDARAAFATTSSVPFFPSSNELGKHRQEQQPLRDLFWAKQRLQTQLQDASDRVFKLLNVAHRQARNIVEGAESLEGFDTFVVSGSSVSSSVPPELWEASLTTLRSLEGLSKLERHRARVVYRQLLGLQQEQLHVQQQLHGNPWLQQTKQVLQRQQRLIEQVTERISRLSAINKGRSHTGSLSDAVKGLTARAYRALVSQKAAELICFVREKRDILAAYGEIATSILPRSSLEEAEEVQSLLIRNDAINNLLNEVLRKLKKHMQAKTILQVVNSSQSILLKVDHLWRLAEANFLHLRALQQGGLLATTKEKEEAARRSLVFGVGVLRQEAELNSNSAVRILKQVSRARKQLLRGGGDSKRDTSDNSNGRSSKNGEPFVNVAVIRDLLDKVQDTAETAIETMDAVKVAAKAAECAKSLSETEDLIREAYQCNLRAIRAKREAEQFAFMLDLLILLERDIAHAAERIAWVRTRATDLTSPKGQQINGFLEKFAIAFQEAKQAQDIPSAAVAAASMRSAALMLEDIGLDEELLLGQEELSPPTPLQQGKEIPRQRGRR